jgi:hypothetical protein
MADRDRPRRVARRAPQVPPPGPTATLVPHTTSAFVLEMVAAATGAVFLGDALRRGAWVSALVAGVWTVGFAVGGWAARRRRTQAGPDGLDIRWARHHRHLDWSEIDGFELAPHRRLRVEQLVARTTDGERVAFPHQDARGLALRPELARRFYESLIERLETVRRTAGG